MRPFSPQALVGMALVGAALLAVALLAAPGIAEPENPCPRSDHHVAASSQPRTHRELVPRGAEAVTLCRYRSFGARLVGARQVERVRTIEWLTRHLDALPPFPKGAIVCPNDVGTEILARFHYEDAPDDPVTVELSGCQGASNGHLRRLAARDQRLIRRLEALTG